MARIIVNNGDWGKARADLKTSLDAQNTKFNANLKAAFAPPKPEASASEPRASAQQSPAAKNERGLLARSNPRR